jgi:hypothetical protein
MRPTLRGIVAALAVAVPLLLSACSDQPTEVPPGPEAAAPGGASVVDPIGSCPASSIESQIRALAPPGGLRNSLLSKFKSIPSKVGQRTGTAARDKMFALVDAILDAYYAGQFGGTSAAIQAQVLTVISSLYCFVRLDSPTLPEGSLGEDGVVGVVTPNSPTTTLVVPSEHAAVTIPAGAAPIPTTIVIRILPDEPPPLLTSLDQYPFFYEFSSFPEVTFNVDVLAGICPRDNLDAINANLRLAHNVGPDFGDVEVLPRPAGAVTGLDCTNLGGGEEPSFFRRSSSGLGADAGDGWSSMSRALGPLVSALLPEPLHAATLLVATTGVGGTTKKFSPFGIVDQESNPASLSIVDEEGNPTSGTVSGPGMVFIRTTSQNGDPISRVPVDFEGTVVLTNADGIAAFNWTDATPGATLTATVPNEAPDGEGELGCPSDIPAHDPDDPYRPFVCFTPDEVAFTVESEAEVVVFNDFDMFSNAIDDEENVQLYQNLVNFTGTGSRASRGSVLIHQGHGSRCLDISVQCSVTWTDFVSTMEGEGFSVSYGDDETDPLTTIDSDVKLLILALPMENYSIAEINSLKAFVGEGGRLVFVGEWDGFYGEGIDVENDFLDKMGAELQNIGGMVDCPLTIIPQSSLREHQITAGLTQLSTACHSVVDPGPDDIPLFFDTSGEQLLGAVAKVSLTPISGLFAGVRGASSTTAPSAKARTAVRSNDTKGRDAKSRQ